MFHRFFHSGFVSSGSGAAGKFKISEFF